MDLGYEERTAYSTPLTAVEAGKSAGAPPLASLLPPSCLCIPGIFPEPGPTGTRGNQGQGSGTAALTLPNRELWKFLLKGLNQVRR